METRPASFLCYFVTYCCFICLFTVEVTVKGKVRSFRELLIIFRAVELTR